MEHLLTELGVAVIRGAGEALGNYAMKEGIEAAKKEWEPGWEKDREAGGISDWGKDSETATA
jgi:hypothetical protein